MKQLLLVLVTLAFGQQTLPMADAAGVVAAGRKSVTVSASSEGEAMATAERQNPGWKAISAKKVNPKDPRSRFWAVVMVK